MSLLFIDGFDHQNSVTDLIADVGAFCWRSTNNASFTADGSGLGGTGKAIVFGAGGELSGVLTTPIAVAFFGMQVQVGGSVPEFVIALSNSSTQNPNVSPPTAQVFVSLNPANGRISIWRGVQGGSGSPTLLAQSGNNFFPNNTPFELEVGAVIGTGTSGSVTVNVNTIPLSVSGVNTSLDGNAIFDTISIGSTFGHGTSNNPNVDHFYVCDANTGPGGNPFNTFQGICQIYTLFPASAGASTQWAPNASTNVSQVQEHAMDSDTTFNSDSTVGHKDLFNVTALPANATPLAVQVTGAYRQDTGGTRQVENLLTSGATTFTGTAVILNTGYYYQRDVLPQDPNGNIAWTRTNVDSTQIGYQVAA